MTNTVHQGTSRNLSRQERILLECYTEAIKDSQTTLNGYAKSLQSSVVAIVPLYSGFITLVTGFIKDFQFNLLLLVPVPLLLAAYLFCTVALKPAVFEGSFELDKYSIFRNERLKSKSKKFTAATILFALGLLGMPACLILFLN